MRTARTEAGSLSRHLLDGQKDHRRPADIQIAPTASLLIADDQAGANLSDQLRQVTVDTSVPAQNSHWAGGVTPAANRATEIEMRNASYATSATVPRLAEYAGAGGGPCGP
jgi:hypothetical protein